jgi:hypothetical protein
MEICGIQRFTAKFSDDKPSIPGSKQIFRDTGRDVVARSGECGRGEALLRPVIWAAASWSRCPRSNRPAERAAESIARLARRLCDNWKQAEPWPVILQPRTARADRTHPPQLLLG